MANLLKIKSPFARLSKSSVFSVGIDFGTTNSIACIYHGGKVSFAQESPSDFLKDGRIQKYIELDMLSKHFAPAKRFYNEEFQEDIFCRKSKVLKSDLEAFMSDSLIPSVVAFGKDGNVMCGRSAILKEIDPDYIVVRSAKRMLELINTKNTDLLNSSEGWFFCKEKNLPSIKIFNNIYTCIDVLSIVMEHVVNCAKKTFRNIEINSGVITTPAYFGENSRNIIRTIAQNSGLEVKRIINEPTSAAICYGLKNEQNSCYLVFDLGGGTFDVSVLRFQQGVFQVLSTSGDIFLGGDNFDEEVCKIIQKKIKPMELARNSKLIKTLAREARHHLSKNGRFKKTIKIEGSSVNIEITLEELEDAVRHLVKRTVEITRSAIRDSELKESDVESIIMVGGATNMPIIKKELIKAFGSCILDSINPDLTVATGAAIQSAALDKREDNVTIIDVTPLSLGLEMIGGTVERVITRNTPIPTRQSIVLTTFQNNQTGIELNIVQGEREVAEFCNQLGHISIDVTPQLAGVARVEVTFSLDVDGILNVTSKNLQTGKVKEVTLNTAYNLDDKRIRMLVIQGIENSKKDFSKIMQNKILVKASTSLTHAKKILENGQFEGVGLRGLIDILKKLEDAIKSGVDFVKIDTLNKELESAFQGIITEKK